MTRTAIATLLILCIGMALAFGADAAKPGQSGGPGRAGKGRGADGKNRFGEQFMKQGVQPGQKAPEVAMYDLKGQPADLSSAWKEKPALLITASITCPIAQGTCHQLKPIADGLKEKVNVVVLYTLEAHPKDQNGPYGHAPRGGRGEGHAQPKALQERLELARKYEKEITPGVPVLVDGMDNNGWKALGGGPNLAILVDGSGKVVAKQGWFDPKAMQDEINKLPAADRK